MDRAKRVLITGIGGFTGRYVAQRFIAAGYEVHGTGMDERDDAHYIRCDLADARAVVEVVARVDPHVVVHLAALAFVGHGDVDSFYTVNILGTRHLLEALRERCTHLESVVLASSANVYGNSAGERITEETPPAPANDYAVSKLAMEYMAALRAGSLPMVVVRPFNYTGVGQSDSYVLPKIVSHFQARKSTIELGNIDVYRDFGDVRCVADAYCRLAQSRVTATPVNICSGRTMSLRDVIAICERLTGHRLEINVNPKFVRANEVRVLGGSPDRLRSLIGGWQPPMLEQTIEWMLGDRG